MGYDGLLRYSPNTFETILKKSQILKSFSVITARKHQSKFQNIAFLLVNFSCYWFLPICMISLKRYTIVISCENTFEYKWNSTLRNNFTPLWHSSFSVTALHFSTSTTRQKPPDSTHEFSFQKRKNEQESRLITKICEWAEMFK